MSQVLCFNDVQFDVIPQNSQPWVRGYQIGTALGYGENADVSIRTLYTRHADEFTPAMTAVVTLPTEGGPQETRIFSLRGCHLLAMFARTPVAKAFRKWVLDVIEQYGDRVPVAEPVTLNDVRPSRRSDPERKALTAIINTWVGMAPVHYASARAQVNAHFGVASVDSLTIGQVKDAIQWVQGKIDALQQALPKAAIPGSIPRQSLDERPFIEFADEIERAHAQMQDIQKRLLSKAYRLTLTLCHDIEARTKVPASKRSGKFTLERFLLDHMTYGLDEALTYPSDTLPDYRNPGLYLLGVLRQFNAR